MEKNIADYTDLGRPTGSTEIIEKTDFFVPVNSNLLSDKSGQIGGPQLP
jgi:hypothetical protein